VIPVLLSLPLSPLMFRFYLLAMVSLDSSLCLLSPFFVFFFFFSPELRTEPRALRLLGKRSITELNPQPPPPAFSTIKMFSSSSYFIFSFSGTGPVIPGLQSYLGLHSRCKVSLGYVRLSPACNRLPYRMLL
jgi:hypothetical protein